MFIKGLLMCLTVLCVGFGLHLLHGRLLLPVHTGADTRLTIRVSAHGEAPELESVLKGLLWLRDNGVLRAQIVLTDEGLASEAAEMAQKLSSRNENIEYCIRRMEPYGGNERSE